MRALSQLFDAEWDAAVAHWQASEQVALFDETQLVLCCAVCRWAGVPLPDREAPRIARLLGVVIDSAGARCWHRMRFSRGVRVLLDLYGTDHDARLWPQPERFDRERFRDRRQHPGGPGRPRKDSRFGIARAAENRRLR